MTKTRAIAPPSAARTESPVETPHKHSICPWRSFFPESVHARTASATGRPIRTSGRAFTRIKSPLKGLEAAAI